MKVWIARDADGGLFMFSKKPKKMSTFFMRNNSEDEESTGLWPLPESALQEVTWENSPKEYEMVMDIFELKAQIKKGGNNGQ